MYLYIHRGAPADLAEDVKRLSDDVLNHISIYRRYIHTHTYITLSHSSPPSRGQASCSALHGRVTHANSATGLG